eukprot:scpid12108/ scgid0654/ Fas-binding factor 1
MGPKRAGSGLAAKTGGKSEDDWDLDDLLAGSSMAANSSKPTAAAAGKSATAPGKASSKTGNRGKYDDLMDLSSSDSSTNTTPAKPKAGAVKRPVGDDFDDGLFGASDKKPAAAGRATSAGASAASVGKAGQATAAKKAKKPAAAEDDLFGSSELSDFGLDDSPPAAKKAASKPVSKQPEKSAKLATWPTLSDDDSDFSEPQPSKRPAASKAKDNIEDKPLKNPKPSGTLGKAPGGVTSDAGLFDDDSNFGFDSDDDKAAPAKRQAAVIKTKPTDNLNSLFGKKPSADDQGKSNEGGGGSRRTFDGFASRLGSGSTQPSGAGRTQAVEKSTFSTDDETTSKGRGDKTGSRPSSSKQVSAGGGGAGQAVAESSSASDSSGSIAGGYMPSGTAAATAGGYTPSSGPPRAGRRARADQHERPSTAPGFQAKQVRFTGNLADVERPASVPAKAADDASDLFGIEDAAANTTRRVRGSTSSTGSAGGDTRLQMQDQTPAPRPGREAHASRPHRAGSRDNIHRPASTGDEDDLLGSGGGAAAAAPSSTASKSQALLSGKRITGRKQPTHPGVHETTTTTTPDMSGTAGKLPSNSPSTESHPAAAMTASKAVFSSRDAEQLARLTEENKSLKDELETLKASSVAMEEQLARLDAEKQQISNELASKADEVQAGIKERVELETTVSRQTQDLSNLKLDLSSSKATLSATEAAKGSLETEVSSLQQQLDEARRQADTERRDAARKQATLESEVSRVTEDCGQLRSSLDNAKSDNARECESLREKFRKREEGERELWQQQETRLRDEISQQADRFKNRLDAAHEEIDKTREASRKHVDDLQASHQQEIARLRLDHDRILAMKEEKHEEYVAQLQAAHHNELEHATEMMGQTKSLQGLITKVESRTASLGDLQSKFKSESEKTLEKRERTIQFKEKQLAELHQRLLERETRLEQDHTKWQEATVKIELKHSLQVRDHEQKRRELQEQEARVAALRHAIDQEQQRLSTEHDLHNRQAMEQQEILRKEHKAITDQCLEERRALARDRATLELQRKEIEIHREALEDSKRDMEASMDAESSKLEECRSRWESLKQEEADFKKRSGRLKTKQREVDKKESELMETAERLQKSTRDLEHVKKALVDSRRKEERNARSIQHKQSEYVQSIAELEEQRSKLQQQNKYLSAKYRQSVQEAKMVICASCSRQQSTRAETWQHQHQHQQHQQQPQPEQEASALTAKRKQTEATPDMHFYPSRQHNLSQQLPQPDSNSQAAPQLKSETLPRRHTRERSSVPPQQHLDYHEQMDEHSARAQRHQDHYRARPESSMHISELDASHPRRQQPHHPHRSHEQERRQGQPQKHPSNVHHHHQRSLEDELNDVRGTLEDPDMKERLRRVDERWARMEAGRIDMRKKLMEPGSSMHISEPEASHPSQQPHHPHRHHQQVRHQHQLRKHPSNVHRHEEEDDEDDELEDVRGTAEDPKVKELLRKVDEQIAQMETEVRDTSSD